jgi:transcriptional regulator with XRE-family HTH domain
MAVIKLKTKKIKKKKEEVSKNRLGAIMEKKGVKQSELARYLKADRSYVSRLLSGKNGKCISLPIALKIAKRLGVTIEEIWS